MRPAVLLEMMAMEMANTTGHEYRTVDKPWPIEPGVSPVVRLWVGHLIHGRWRGRRRQRVDLLRQSRRIQSDLPAPVQLLARLSDGLSRLPFNRDPRGEVAAILKVRLRRHERGVRHARGSLPGTGRQDGHHGDTQK